jgi:CDP-6-deoxy-D-xylo-4-hexulose-3-dehydrase
MDIKSPTMAIKQIRYGGSSCDMLEFRAVLKSVNESIKSGGWQQGKEGELLEKELAQNLGVKHAILTTSGSCAGLLVLSAMELPKNTEVIISAVTFPTIFNIILQCGLVPVVVDAKIGTYNFDIDEVINAITPNTRAIIAIHALGNPIDMPELMKRINAINKKRANKIYVIEDNCDGWGTTIKGRKIGSFGDISITSFHAAHIISMGVGGGVFTSNSKLARNVRMYRDWGRQANTTAKNKYESLPKDYNPRFIYEKIGYNFQILDLQAAMGRVQLRKADKIKKLRKKNFDYLVKHLSKYKNEMFFPETIEGADVCWFALPLTYAGDRGKLVKHLEKNGIETRSMFAGQIHKHPCYANSEYKLSGSLKDSEYILKHSFWIGVHPRMTQEDREYVVKQFDDFFSEENEKYGIHNISV